MQTLVRDREGARHLHDRVAFDSGKSSGSWLPIAPSMAATTESLGELAVHERCWKPASAASNDHDVGSASML